MGDDRAIMTVKGPWISKSSRTGMVKLWLVWPATKTNVPEVAV